MGRRAKRRMRIVAGCACGVSVPNATWTVTGVFARHACSSRLAGHVRRAQGGQARRQALRAGACVRGNRGIPFAAGFFRRAEAPVRQHGFHVFAGLIPPARSRNRGWTPSRSWRTRGETAAHQVDQNRRQAALDHMPAHAPEDRFPAARAADMASTTARNESPARMCGRLSSSPHAGAG
jgi:hypothetical protein